MVDASKSEGENSQIPRLHCFLTVKKKKAKTAGKNMHCRGTWPDKPVLKISTAFGKSGPLCIFHCSVCGDGGREEEHGKPCAAREELKPLKFCYFIRAAAILLMSNSQQWSLFHPGTPE